MQNQLENQYEKLKQSIDAAAKAPFIKKGEAAEAVAKESMSMCGLLMQELAEVKRELGELKNG